MNKEVLPAKELSWESSYEVALALMAQHPGENLENVSLGDIFNWTIALENFADEAELANEDILASIYQEWFEELNPL